MREEISPAQAAAFSGFSIKTLRDWRRAAIVGRVSMDVTVVNITGMDGVGVGDVATLIGRDGAEEITLDEVADVAGTISYEVLTGFTSRLPRVWEGKGQDGG